MARHDDVETSSRRSRRKRGAYDELWSAVSYGCIGIGFRQPDQFAWLGGRRWRRAFVERDRIDFRPCFWPCCRIWFWRGKTAPNRVSRTRQARPAAKRRSAAPGLIRRRGSRLAREPGGGAQESVEGRGKEFNRRGGRCASALHTRVPGERARDRSLHHS